MTTIQGGLPIRSVRRVLLAEDSPLQEKLAVRLLENEGYTVQVAHNGKEAVDAMEIYEYDLVFMDVEMPVMDGLQATTVIRGREVATGHHTYVIAITATATREECLAAGMDGHVVKPLTASVLKQTIRETLGFRNDPEPENTERTSMIHPRFGTRMIVGLLCSAAAIVNAQEVSSHSKIREPTGFAVYDVLQADSAGTRVIDLTHAFGDRTIYWPTEDGFQLQRGPAGVTERGYYYSANRFSAAEHGGTHLDAPIHFFKDHQTVDQIPMWRLFGEAAVIDVSQQCVDQSDYEVSIADLRRWEESHDRQLVDVILLLRTGYDKHWPDRERYLGTKSMGPEAVKQLHFPGLDPVAAQWLVDQRAIKAVGIDTASIDTGQSRQFGSHVHLCEHNVPIFENVANLDNLPSSGSTVIALPMKIDGGSGAPLRIIGILHAGVAGLTDEEELPPIECPLRKAGIDKTKLKPFEEVEEYVKFLERADRAEWQRPDAVVKALGLNGTETLVDLGSGSGYFTFRFSKALPQGKVIAIDTQPEMVRHVHRKVLTGQWPNVRAQVGQPDNPGLPANADCVFVCDVLLHVRQKLDWLKTVHSEMRPGAKLVLIDFREGDLPEGPPEERKVPKKDLLQLCREAGFRLERDESDLLPYQEFLVFERTGP